MLLALSMAASHQRYEVGNPQQQSWDYVSLFALWLLLGLLQSPQISKRSGVSHGRSSVQRVHCSALLCDWTEPQLFDQDAECCNSQCHAQTKKALQAPILSTVKGYADLNKAASLRLGLMLEEMLRAAGRAEASHEGATSGATLGS